MPETDAFALAYRRLAATTVAGAGPTAGAAPALVQTREGRPSLLLPRLDPLRPKAGHRGPGQRPT